MNKNIKLISLDVDGTLLDNHGDLPEENLRVLRIVQEAGIVVLLNTGKPVNAIQKEIALLNIQGPIVTLAGSMTLARNAFGNYSISHIIPIEENQALNVMGILAQTRASVIVITTKNTYVSHSKAQPEYQQFFREIAASTNMPEMMQVGHQDLGNPLAIERPIVKMMVICDEEEELNQIVRLYQAQYSDQLTLLRSSPGTIDIYSSESGKLQALKAVCAEMKITRENVLAMGDYHTDLEAVKWAGMGAIMGNAPQAVLVQAPMVAPSNVDCGVARFITQYVLEG
ncbi:MAG: HAD-IIB family hydrolase [Chloroflexi bacterium]|nr:HAD-IIB family hydrolase [Chloroflexota bacterium]